MNTIPISDAARLLAEKINTKVDRWIRPFMPVAEVEELCQGYFNSATEKLREENGRLKQNIKTWERH